MLFLNDQASFEGGDLRLYGLLGDERWRGVGIPIPAKSGRLIAFRTELVHEVRKVTLGERYTVVSWYSS